MLAEPVNADEALEWGLIWQVVDDVALAEETLRLAKHLATQPTAAFDKIKQAIDAAASNRFDEQLALEGRLQGASSDSHDFKEGVQAFLDKRAPNFKGN